MLIQLLVFIESIFEVANIGLTPNSYQFVLLYNNKN